jgi:UDP-GlcNAc:undecaprenyl-phosphate/decaprenyl-phosphate GlcNAc-1-phosphate transferase
VSAVATWLSLWILKRWAPRIGLMACAGEHRAHSEPTPMVGGIALAIAVIGALCLMGDHPGLGFGILLLSFIGVIDDRFEIPHFWRFVVQTLAAWLIVSVDGMSLFNLGELVPGGTVYPGRWTTAVTIFSVVGVINALNMSDGMDGLVGSLCLAMVLFFLLLGAPDTTLLWVLALSLLVFLSFNLRLNGHAARVYLGDSGSTVLGFILSWFLIRYSQGETAVLSPVSGLWILALPLMDAVSVLFGRPIKGLSAFSADRSHYHHKILRYAGSVNIALTIILTITVLGFGVAYAVAVGMVSEPVGFGAFLAIFGVWFIGYLVSKPD